MICRNCATERRQQTTKQKPAQRERMYFEYTVARVNQHIWHNNKSHVPRVSKKSRALREASLTATSYITPRVYI